VYRLILLLKQSAIITAQYAYLVPTRATELLSILVRLLLVVIVLAIVAPILHWPVRPILKRKLVDKKIDILFQSGLNKLYSWFSASL